MTIALRFRPVLKIIPGMQNLIVMQKLNIAGLKYHLQSKSGFLQDRIDQVHDLHLLFGEVWCIGKATLRFLNVVAADKCTIVYCHTS